MTKKILDDLISAIPRSIILGGGLGAWGIYNLFTKKIANNKEIFVAAAASIISGLTANHFLKLENNKYFNAFALAFYPIAMGMFLGSIAGQFIVKNKDLDSKGENKLITENVNETIENSRLNKVNFYSKLGGAVGALTAIGVWTAKYLVENKSLNLTK